MEGFCLSTICSVFLPQFPEICSWLDLSVRKSRKNKCLWVPARCVCRCRPGEVAELVTFEPHLCLFLVMILSSIRGWLGSQPGQEIKRSTQQDRQPAIVSLLFSNTHLNRGPLLQNEVPNSLAWPLRPWPLAPSLFVPLCHSKPSQGFSTL